MKTSLKRKIKRLFLICAVLFVAVHYFGLDLRGMMSAATTVVLDTAEKIIPGTRAQFEDIDAQINSRIVKSGAAKNLSDSAEQAMKKASAFINRAWLETKCFALRHGVNVDSLFDSLFKPIPQRKSSGGGAKSTYSFEYENVNIAEASALRQKLIDYSMTLRGVPYVLGSESPSTGFDCSSFVRYSAKNGIGVQLPRTAREQYAVVERISSSEREPGDLLFFRRFGKVDHVGIYLGRYSGSGTLNGREIFINAASEGPRTGVVVSALDEPYWRRHYSSSGRFLPSSLEAAENQVQAEGEATSL